MGKKYTQKYKLFDSIEEMLSVETMSHILQRTVSQVTYKPFSMKKGTSGSRMYNVLVDNEHLIMKHLSPTTEWKSLASHDEKCRSVTVWQYGVLDRLLPNIEHITIAACRDDNDYAILMRDVSSGLFDDHQVTKVDIFALLDRMVAMHALYWEDDKLRDPSLGLCSLQTLLQQYWLSQRDLYKHVESGVDSVTMGWEILMDSVKQDVRDFIQSILDNPLPFLKSLQRYPATFIHGSLHFGNCAILPDTRQVVGFDWEDATYGPSVIDFGFFVTLEQVFPFREAVVDYYHKQLSKTLGNRFDQNHWVGMLELGMVFEVLSKGCWKAYFSVMHPNEEKRSQLKEVVISYDKIIRNGVRWL